MSVLLTVVPEVMKRKHFSEYEACSNKTSSGIVVSKGVEAVKIVPIGIEAGISLTHQPMDSLSPAAGTTTSSTSSYHLNLRGP